MSALLSVAELDAFYGRAQILFDITLEVGRGEVVALLGRNGAGKSTMLKAIIGLVTNVRGRRSFDGRDLASLPSYRIAQAGLSYVPEERRIFTDLTVAENLEVGRQPPRADAPHWTPERVFELFPNLAEMRGRRGSQMSGGEQQMLTIARSLMGNPRAILLDEPSEGLAPVIVEQMARTIAALKREGMTVLLSEQNLYFAHALADRAYVIEGGRIRYQGSMDALMANDTVRRTYLTV
ncbi:MAG TPA: ABC transporter ATP-binding protein [Alphaproteobacteria bacterium]|nr:ABC transporter ATP-binding protein [Alphaproteobacteria bacterium]